MRTLLTLTTLLLLLGSFNASAQFSPFNSSSSFEDYVVQDAGDTLFGTIVKQTAKKVTFRSVDGRKLQLSPWDIRGYFDFHKNLYLMSKLDRENSRMIFVVPIILKRCSFYLWTDGYVSNKENNFKVLEAETLRYFAEPENYEMMELDSKKAYKELVRILGESCPEFSDIYNTLQARPGHIFARGPDETNVFNFLYDLIDLYNQQGCE